MEKRQIQYVLVTLAILLAIVGSYFGITLPAPAIPTPDEGIGAQAVRERISIEASEDVILKQGADLLVYSDDEATQKFSIDGATGALDVQGGGLTLRNDETIDNYPDGTIGITATTVSARGNLETTGALDVQGGAVTLRNDETIDNYPNGTIGITATTVSARGNLETTGALDVQGGAVTLRNDETIDNYPDGTVAITATNVVANGTFDVSGTLNYGTDNLYPVGYASSGTALVGGVTATFTGTTTVASGLTTVISAVCVPYSVAVAAAATCGADWSGATVTLRSWKADGVTAGDVGTTVNYLIFGAK